MSQRSASAVDKRLILQLVCLRFCFFFFFSGLLSQVAAGVLS